MSDFDDCSVDFCVIDKHLAIHVGNTILEIDQLSLAWVDFYIRNPNTCQQIDDGHQEVKHVWSS